MNVTVQNEFERSTSFLDEFFKPGDIVIYHGIQKGVAVGLVEEYLGAGEGVAVVLWSRPLGRFVPPLLLPARTLTRIGRVDR